jgi:hypothetical protein
MLASGKVDVVDGGLKKETKEKERIQWWFVGGNEEEKELNKRVKRKMG